MNSGFVTILGSRDGVALVGDPLFVRLGDVDMSRRNMDRPLTYQWYGDGYLIPTATSNRYTVQKDDVGQKITVVVTMTLVDGSFVRVNTPRPITVSSSQKETLRVLYTHLLKRQPDEPGLDFWADYLIDLEESGDPFALATVVTAFMSSDDYKKEVSNL